MLTEQQKWNRYCGAINFCIGCEYFIDCIYNKTNEDPDAYKIKGIKVFNPHNGREANIYLKPKHYGAYELLEMIINRVGKTNCLTKK